MGVLSNRIDKSELKGGDHIYSWRKAYTYSHHGIYVGSGKVVHFTRGEGQELGTGTFLDAFVSSSVPRQTCLTCPDCGFQRENSGVLLSCLECFLAEGPLYRFEYGVSPAYFLAKARGGTCTLAESDPADEVIHRVMYLLHKGFGNYHIFRNNCEDFAIYCKTGFLLLDNTLGRSGQAASFIGAPTAAILSSPLRFLMGGPIGVATLTAGAYCLSRYATDIGVRMDKVKVAVEDLHANLGLTEETDLTGENASLKAENMVAENASSREKNIAGENSSKNQPNDSTEENLAAENSSRSKPNERTEEHLAGKSPSRIQPDESIEENMAVENSLSREQGKSITYISDDDECVEIWEKPPTNQRRNLSK